MNFVLKIGPISIYAMGKGMGFYTFIAINAKTIYRRTKEIEITHIKIAVPIPFHH